MVSPVTSLDGPSTSGTEPQSLTSTLFRLTTTLKRRGRCKSTNPRPPSSPYRPEEVPDRSVRTHLLLFVFVSYRRFRPGVDLLPSGDSTLFLPQRCSDFSTHVLLYYVNDFAAPTTGPSVSDSAPKPPFTKVRGPHCDPLHNLQPTNLHLSFNKPPPLPILDSLFHNLDMDTCVYIHLYTHSSVTPTTISSLPLLPLGRSLHVFPVIDRYHPLSLILPEIPTRQLTPVTVVPRPSSSPLPSATGVDGRDFRHPLLLLRRQ